MFDSLFFSFSKILTVFLFPLPLFFLISFLSLFFVRGIRQKVLVGIPIFFLYFFSNSCIANALIKSLESEFKAVPMELVPEADVIVVLGGMIQTISVKPGRPELTESADRLVDAVRLYKLGKAKKILFSGGSGLLLESSFKEADLAKSLLLDLGVKEEDLWIESNSRNTWENAKESEIILKEKRTKSILLITSAFHMKRSLGCFSKLNLPIFAYPTDYRGISTHSSAFDLWLPSPGFLELSTLALKEWVGIFVYSLK